MAKEQPEQPKPPKASKKASPKTGNNKKTPKDLRSSALKKKGIKYGITSIHQSQIIEPESDDEDEQVFWHEEREEIKNPCLRCLRRIAVFLMLLPEDPMDSTPLKNGLRWMQWAALLADLSAALVAIITFNGVAYCCDEEILNFGGTDIPWHTFIRILTYLYLGLVFCEVYPVVRKGFPLNLANPLIGFIISIAMFFDDSKVEALVMWAIETLAVMFEFIVFRLKVVQKAQRAREVKRVAKQTKRTPDDDEDIEKAARDLKKVRQRYYQLKEEQEAEDKVLWYLRLGVYINMALVLLFLAIIICISQSGGLCVNGESVPNPFNLNQKENCGECADVQGFCEVCTEEIRQCYFPYD